MKPKNEHPPAADEQINHDIVGFDSGYRFVVRDSTYSKTARVAYVIISSFASGRLGCIISNERLAKYVGCTKRQLQEKIKELSDRGAISVEISPDRHSRKIKICAEVSITGKVSEHEENCTPCAKISAPMHAENFTQGMDIGLDLRNTNNAPTGAVCEVDPKQEDIFKRFYDTYDRDRRKGNTKAEIRKALNKVLAEGVAPEKIYASIEEKKKRLDAYKRDPRHNKFEPGFPYPVKFLRQQPWEDSSAVQSENPKRAPDGFSAIDRRFPNIVPSILSDLRKLKATEEELKEINTRWEYWKALKLNGDSMTDGQWLEKVREAMAALMKPQEKTGLCSSA